MVEKKSKGNGWGGARPGAGRKANPLADNPNQEAGAFKAEDLINRRAKEIEAKAPAPGPRARQKKAVVIMREIAQTYYALAAQYQPTATNPNANEKKFLEYSRLAGLMSSKLAPFESPTYAPIKLAPIPLDLDKLSEQELETLERLHAKAAVDPGDQGGEGTQAPPPGSSEGAPLN